MTLVSADCARHLLESAELLEGLLGDFLRHPGLPDLLGVLVDLGLDLVVLAELLLDRFELLAEEVLALGLGHRLFDAVLDLASKLEDLEFLLEEAGRLLEPLARVDRVEDLLLLGDLHVQMERHEIGEAPRLGECARGDDDLLRDGLAELRRVLEVRRRARA